MQENFGTNQESYSYLQESRMANQNMNTPHCKWEKKKKKKKKKPKN